MPRLAAGEKDIMIPTKIFQSPNYAIRKALFTPLALVYHITQGSAESVKQAFLSRSYEKSTHYLILKNGDLWQFVDEKYAAWGNGIVWKPTAPMVLELNSNPNDWTIAIEHEAFSWEELTPAQYQTSAKLTDELTKKYDIGLDRKHLIRHSEIRASKTCPDKLDINKIIRMILEIRSPGMQIAPVQEEKIKQLNLIQQQILKIQELMSRFLKNKKLGNINSEK